MGLAQFSAAAVGLLAWLLLCILLLPRALARGLSAIVSRRRDVQLSLASLTLHPLTGTATLSRLTLTTPDGTLSLHALSLTLRYWRSVPPPPLSAAHPTPPLLTLSLSGATLRVCNNRAAYDALAALLASPSSPSSPSPSPPAADLPPLARALLPHAELRVAGAVLCACDPARPAAPALALALDGARARAWPGEGGGEIALRARGDGVVLSALRQTEGGDVLAVPEELAIGAAEGLSVEMDVEARGRAKVVLEGALFEHDPPAIAVLEEVIQRVSPPLCHLAVAGEGESLVVSIEAAPRAGCPLMALPFEPRDTTWGVLSTLGVRRWPGQPDPCAHVDMERKKSASALNGDGGRSGSLQPPDLVQLPRSSLDVYAESARVDISIPNDAVGDGAFRVHASIVDVVMKASGVLDMPLLKAPSATVVYEEPLTPVWNDAKTNMVDVQLDNPVVAYSTDVVRMFDDRGAYVLAHMRMPDTVARFIPMGLDVHVHADAGYTIRVSMLESCAWPELETALDDCLPAPIAELRGPSATLRVQAAAGLEFSPLVVETDWSLELPDAEVYLNFPLGSTGSEHAPAGLPSGDGPAPEFADEDQELLRRSRAIARTFSAIPERWRGAADDAAHPASRSRMTFVGGPGVGARPGHAAAMAGPVVLAQHSIRIGRINGMLRISGAARLYTTDALRLPDIARVRVEADHILFDSNPHHVFFLIKTAENLTGTQSHPLSFEERTAMRHSRVDLQKDLSNCPRTPSSCEATVLGSAVERIFAHVNQGVGERAFVTVLLHKIELRVHDVPHATSPLLLKSSSVNTLSAGPLRVETRATMGGIILRVAHEEPDTPIVLSPRCATKGSEPCSIRVTGFEVTRMALNDSNGAPYVVQTQLRLNAIEGSMAASNLAHLVRFCTGIRPAASPTASPATDALWFIFSLEAISDSVDVLIPLCDPETTSHASGVLRVSLERGFRVCLGNLCSTNGSGFQTVSVPSLVCRMYTPNSPSAVVSWKDGEGAIRSRIHLCDEREKDAIPTDPRSNSLVCDGSMGDGLIRVVGAERARGWCGDFVRAQRGRLRNAEQYPGRASYLLGGGPLRRHDPNCVPLYDFPWWNTGVARTQRENTGAARDETNQIPDGRDLEICVDILSRLDIGIGPRSLTALHRFLVRRGEACGQHTIPSRGLAGFSEKDILALWRTVTGDFSVPEAEDFVPPGEDRVRVFVALQSINVVLVSPLSLLQGHALSAGEAARFGSLHARDSVSLVVPDGVRLAGSHRQSHGGNSPEARSVALCSISAILVSALDSQDVMSLQDVTARVSSEPDSCASDTLVRSHRTFDLCFGRLILQTGSVDAGPIQTFGRVLLVHALILKSIGVEVRRLEVLEEARQRALSKQFDDVTSEQLTTAFCRAIYALRGSSGVGRNVPAVASVPSMADDPFSYVTEHSWSRLQDPRRFASSASLSGLADRGTDSPATAWGPDVPSYSSKLSFHLTELTGYVLGHTSLAVQGVEFTVRDEGGGDTIVVVQSGLCQLSSRSDTLSCLCNVVASIMSHATSANAYLPLVRAHGHASGMPGANRVGSVPDRAESLPEPMARGSDTHFSVVSDRHPRASAALKVFKRSGSRSASSWWRPGAEATNMDQASTRAKSSPVRDSGHQEDKAGGLGGDESLLSEGHFSRRPWLQRVSQAAESAIHSVSASLSHPKRDSAPVVSPAEGTSHVHTASPTSTLTALIVLQGAELSHFAAKHSRNLVEADLHVKVGCVSSSLTKGPSAALCSATLVARTVGILSKGGNLCTLRGSMDRIRSFVSLAPGSRPLNDSRAVASIQFQGVVLSMEASDLSSVKVFTEQLKQDVNRVGASLMLVETSMRDMVRSTHVLNSTPNSDAPARGISISSVAGDFHANDTRVSLIGFHPRDTAMQISHETRSMFTSVVLSDEETAVLSLACRLQGHGLVISASQWSTEERIAFPNIDISGVQWSHESDLPTQLQLFAGPFVNEVSFQGVRNLLYAATGLLKFQSAQTRSSGYWKEPDTAPPVVPSRTQPLDQGAASRPSQDPSIRDLKKAWPTFGRALSAWERTKAVRMDTRIDPVSLCLSSGAVVMVLEGGTIGGVVEWNKSVDSGIQLQGALEVTKCSLMYARSVGDSFLSRRQRDMASLLVDVSRVRLDVLKSQSGVVHKFLFRCSVNSVRSVVLPWQLMADAAVWSDEQEFIREMQEMHLQVAAELSKGTTTEKQPAVQLATAGEEHRLFEVGVDVSSGSMSIPLLVEENADNCRLSVEFRDIQARARYGDEVALPSHINLARLKVRSMGFLWQGLDLIKSTDAHMSFAAKRSPSRSGSHFGSLNGALYLGSWVISPRKDFVLAVVDARLARRATSVRKARAKLESVQELFRGGSASTSVPGHSRDDSRLIFEEVEVYVLPSPGFIEALDSSASARQDPFPPSAGGSASSRFSTYRVLQVPIPKFSIRFLRLPSHDFDLLDVSFSRRIHEKFPDGCLSKAANIFSELFGAVASRTKVHEESATSDEDLVSAQTWEFTRMDGSVGSAVPAARPSTRDWSALIRLGEAQYVAHENVYGKLPTRFAFYAGEASGVLASTLSPDMVGAPTGADSQLVPHTATVVAGVSPAFRLEVQPELEDSIPQSLALTSVKVLQGYTMGSTPHTMVHVSEVKAELDLMTLLLSRQWIYRDKFGRGSGAEVPREDHTGSSRQQASVALARAAPVETKVLLVLGESSPDLRDGVARVSSTASRAGHRALSVRMRLSQPDGRVGLVVRRVKLGLSRHLAVSPESEKNADVPLYTDACLVIEEVSSRAKWEHLSATCGFQHLMICGDVTNEISDRTERKNVTHVDKFIACGGAFIVRSMRFKCKRDDSDALKLEVAGAAAALTVNEDQCQASVETTTVDAYISSSTVKTVRRLKQLQSRLVRGLRPQVERLILAELRRDGSRHSGSLDSLGFPLASSAVAPTPNGATRSHQAESSRDQSSVDSQREAAKSVLAGRVLVSGDSLVLTMHGFSFDDTQPQAKLMFSTYDLEFEQRESSIEEDLETMEKYSMSGFRTRRGAMSIASSLSLRYQLLDIQYSDQRQQSVTVMSLPDPHLAFKVLETPEVVFVDFFTHFNAPVETSPSVSHYDYLRQLMSLYQTATSSSPAEGTHGQDASESSMMRSLGAVQGVRTRNHGGVTVSSSSTSESLGVSHREVAKWGGRHVIFRRIEFSPRLSPLGDLTPSVATVLGWLGVGGIEALPSGVYEILMIPLSTAVTRVSEACRGPQA